MSEATASSETLTGAEVVDDIRRNVENTVAGTEFDQSDSVYRAHLKAFDTVTRAAGKQNPEFWDNVSAHLHAAGKQTEYMVKDFVWWALKGGPIGGAARFVGEHLPLVGGVFKGVDASVDTAFKPSERERRRVQELTTMRIGVKNVENRINGTVGWIMGKT